MGLLVIDFPHSDFVVLMGTEEFIAQNYYGLHCTLSHRYHVVTYILMIKFRVQVLLPQSDFFVRRSTKQEISSKGKGGYVGRVAFESGDAMVGGGGAGKIELLLLGL